MKDQVWWVTGASSGIGAALARGLAARGAKLILSGRNVAALEAAARDIGPGTMILPFEATDYAALPRMVEEAWNWCGRIDGLVNNAGISQRSLAVDTDFSVYQKIVDVDLLAPIALTQQLLPRMIKAGGGQIVAISSVAGIAGVPLRSAYCAAKHGLIGYHDSVRAENEHLGLKVLVVAPGLALDNFEISGPPNVPLPVEMLYFSGEAHPGFNRLEWATATEINNSGFAVERSRELLGHGDRWHRALLASTRSGRGPTLRPAASRRTRRSRSHRWVPSDRGVVRHCQGRCGAGDAGDPRRGGDDREDRRALRGRRR